MGRPAGTSTEGKEVEGGRRLRPRGPVHRRELDNGSGSLLKRFYKGPRGTVPGTGREGRGLTYGRLERGPRLRDRRREGLGKRCGEGALGQFYVALAPPTFGGHRGVSSDSP